MTSRFRIQNGWYITALLASSAPQAWSQQEPPQALTTSGNLSLVSDYTIRGITQTQGKPSLRGQLSLTHASGLYATFMGSGVSHAAYPNGSGTEIDLIGGYQTTLASGLGVNVGYGAYFFPGAHATSDGTRYNTQEILTTLSYQDFNIGAAVVTSRNLFGIYGVDPSGVKQHSRGSLYLEANWAPPLGHGFNLDLHIGRQQIRGMRAMSATDYKIGITVSGDSHGFKGWGASLAWLYNNGNHTLWTYFDGDGRGKVAVGSRVVASLSYNF